MLCVQDRMMRLTFSKVRDESGEEHHEVIGRMPDLANKLQSSLSSSGDMLEQLLTKAAADLQVLADFGKNVVLAAQDPGPDSD